MSAPRISQDPVTGYPGESQGMYGPVRYGGFETYPVTRASQAPGPTALPNSTSGFLPRWPPAEPRGYPSEIPSQATTWNSSLGGASTVPAPRGDTFQWGHTAPEAHNLPGEPFDPTLSLEKRRLWWDKFQYTALMGGWREQERCTHLYSRLSHNEETKAWIQRISDSVRRSWQQLSDKFAKEFCRSTESPVKRYLDLNQETRETPRTFLWRLNAPAVKANVDYCTASGCRRHFNQFLKNLRDRELQLSLQGRLYLSTDEMEDLSTDEMEDLSTDEMEDLSTDEMEDTLRQVEEMERGMRRKPANDIQFGRYKPPATCRESRELSPDELHWEDEDDEAYGYQYDEEDNDYDVQSPRQEDVFRAEDPRGFAPGMTVSEDDPGLRKVLLDEVQKLLRVSRLAPSAVAWDIRKKSAGDS
ncbi:hypothetical protein PHYPSEUDO_013917 [Phytophthora pseudosyringae]|uniref:Retrotransposon gag domain-containing protein n=1 Tax=Phytophthora pseudosyringae TaxID=221518 RepID=A0A8T1V5H6_9STRA|nr:hypothetical protein PHYPSEUDO_013917 [Phytophthora pseudosyringae]